MGVVVRRFEVFLIALDPTVGKEIRKTRPCLVVSPDEMNRHVATVLVAPMTTKGQPYPTRVPCRFRGKAGMIALDQIRAVDRSRLVRRLGRIAPVAQDAVLSTLAELFAK
jgi:mRNA interferase MazF